LQCSIATKKKNKKKTLRWEESGLFNAEKLLIRSILYK
jgi:hypothetical protein